MADQPLVHFLGFVFPDYVKSGTDNAQFAERIRNEQVRDLRRLLEPMSLASLAGALILCLVNLTPENAPLLLGWFLVFLLFLALPGLLRHLTKFQGTKKEPRTSRKRIASLSVQICVAGLMWSLVPVLFFPGANPEQKIFVALTVAGVLGSGAMSFKAVPRIAGAFSAIITTGMIIGLALDSARTSFALVLLMAFYFTAIMHAANEAGRLFVESLVQQFEIEKSKELFGVLFRDFEDSASDWMWEVNQDCVISHISPQFFKDPRANGFPIHGRALRHALKDPTVDVNAGRVGRMPRALVEAFVRRVAFKDIVTAVMIDGQRRYWKLSGRPIRSSDGSFLGMRGACSDVSESFEAENRLQYLAMHDAMTGLPNRESFNRTFSLALAKSQAHGGGEIALLTIDLDKFKMVNDTLGHQAGDEVLACVAARLKLLASDGMSISRFGGDEFCAFIPGPDASEKAEKFAGQVIDALSQPMKLTSGQIEIGCSIGICLAPRDGLTAETLYRNSDLALYRAKIEPRSAFRVFESNMDAAARKQQELEYELRSALQRNEFELYFQPLADATTGEITGQETLLRWNSEKFGRVPPDEFIRIAEKSGLINEIGEWVLRKACIEAAGWRDGSSVAVNLSPRQMDGYRILEVVKSALADSGLLPSRLELEVTETVLEADPNHVAGLLRSLRAIGARISLDDFGTGYSSLSYLVRFPFDKLKIDRSFIQGAMASNQSLAIIRAIVMLARSLGVKTTAEGVETQQQADMLRLEGIDEFQGYLISRPKPAAHLAAQNQTRHLDRLAG